MGWPRLSLRRTDVTAVASVKQISGAVIAALLSIGVGLGAYAHAESLDQQPLTFITASGRHDVTVEVADSDQERSMGLMFRRSLPEDKGMIFLYPQDEEITMWMKNTYISLDMIFVTANGSVHRIEERTEPFSESIIASGGKVRAVIEMIGGSAQRLGLKPGDTVEFSAFR